MKDATYLTLDQLIAIHDSMIEEYGGSFGIRDLGLIQSALARPQSSFDGDDLYSDIFSKAASLFHSLIFNHAFVDGNKRASMTATARFLYLNGYELDVTQKEFVAFPLRVENTHPSFEEILAWFKKNSRRIKQVR